MNKKLNVITIGDLGNYSRVVLLKQYRSAKKNGRPSYQSLENMKSLPLRLQTYFRRAKLG